MYAEGIKEEIAGCERMGALTEAASPAVRAVPAPAARKSLAVLRSSLRGCLAVAGLLAGVAGAFVDNLMLAGAGAVLFAICASVGADRR